MNWISSSFKVQFHVIVKYLPLLENDLLRPIFHFCSPLLDLLLISSFSVFSILLFSTTNVAARVTRGELGERGLGIRGGSSVCLTNIGELGALRDLKSRASGGGR